LHDAPRYVGGTYRLDNYLDDPLTFADRAEADKVASHWNALRGDGQDMTVSLSVEDFYNAFANQLDSALLFDEKMLCKSGRFAGVVVVKHRHHHDD
jgi:hypothetical protein